MSIKKDLRKDDHNSFIHNIPKLETACLPINKKVDKLQCTHTVEYYQVILKKNKLLMCAVTQMTFKTIMLSERALHTRTENAWFMCSSRPGKFNLWLKESQYKNCLWERGSRDRWGI